jgi:hypothetical protein
MSGDKLTETIQIMKPLTDAQRLELLDQIAYSYDKIAELELQLDDLKEQMKPVRDSIESEKDNVAQALANKKAGFIPVNVECFVVYNGDTATYTSVETGEIVRERVLSESEQLQLSENRVDAEKIIREDSNNE